MPIFGFYRTFLERFASRISYTCNFCVFSKYSIPITPRGNGCVCLRKDLRNANETNVTVSAFAHKFTTTISIVSIFFPACIIKRIRNVFSPHEFSKTTVTEEIPGGERVCVETECGITTRLRSPVP